MLLNWIPCVGTVLSFTLTAWLHSFYCFNYQWNMQGIPLKTQIALLEHNWAYFFGFGAVPWALVTFFGEPMISMGIYSMVFPFCILLAISSDSDFRDTDQIMTSDLVRRQLN